MGIIVTMLTNHIFVPFSPAMRYNQVHEHANFSTVFGIFGGRKRALY